MRTRFKVAIGVVLAVTVAWPVGLQIARMRASKAVSATGIKALSEAPTKAPAGSSSLPGIGSSAASWRQRHTPFDGDKEGLLFGPVLSGGDPTYSMVISGAVAGKDGRLVGYQRQFPSGTSLLESMVLVREELPDDTSMKEIASGPHCVLNEASSASFTKELPGKSVYLTTYTKDKVVGDRSETTRVDLSIAASGGGGLCTQMPPLS